MRYIGFDMGDGESAVAAFEHGSGIEPRILPICGVKSLLSAVGTVHGEIVIGERAYTEALADGLSVRFKSRFTTDSSSNEDIVRFVRGVLRELTDAGQIHPDDRFVVGCPAGWTSVCRARYRELLMHAGMVNPQVISESRAAFLYAKHAHAVAVDLDIMNESALVIDIGSSTLDYAYIVDGRETGIGTFGEMALGGGVLDAAILRRSVERSRDHSKIQSVFAECRSWYSYCEIEARRVKEEFFTRLASEAAPVVKKGLRVCYDGVQKLTLELTKGEIDHIVHEALPELDGRSFADALRTSLDHARRVTLDRPPRLLLLTGGASRMPFFREMCAQAFPQAAIVSCPEPEFSIAKGLAYAGWVDENLRAFRQEIQQELSDKVVGDKVRQALPALLPSFAKELTSLVLQEAALPVAKQWKCGAIRTLEAMNAQMTDRARRVIASPMAQEALAPALYLWLGGLENDLQAMVDPICDRYHVPRKQMRLQLAAATAGDVSLNAGEWMGLATARSILGALMGVAAGMLCGGGGTALIAAGPLGFLAGAVAGMITALLGWPAVSGLLLKADLPVVMRAVPIEKTLSSQKVRHDLEKKLLQSMIDPSGNFESQMTDSFTRSLRHRLNTIAQAVEIPIE